MKKGHHSSSVPIIAKGQKSLDYYYVVVKPDMFVTLVRKTKIKQKSVGEDEEDVKKGTETLCGGIQATKEKTLKEKKKKEKSGNPEVGTGHGIPRHVLKVLTLEVSGLALFFGNANTLN